MPVKQIADETELSDDTVRRYLADLVARGLITRTPTKRCGGRWHDWYTVTLPATCGEPSPHHAETLLARCGDPPRPIRGNPRTMGGTSIASLSIKEARERRRKRRRLPRQKDRRRSRSGVSRQRSERSLPTWEPSDVDIAFAKDQGLTDLDIDRDKVKFRNYYRERRPVRKSWPKTWENWVIGTAEKFGRVPVVTAPGAPDSPRFQVFVDTPQWEAWREYWKRTRNNLSPKEDDIRDKKTGRCEGDGNSNQNIRPATNKNRRRWRPDLPHDLRDTTMSSTPHSPSTWRRNSARRRRRRHQARRTTTKTKAPLHYGTVASWDEARGFELIADADGGNDIFVHVSAAEQAGIELSEGLRLRYDVGVDARNNRPMATNLKLAA